MFSPTKIYHFRDLRQNLTGLRSLRIDDLSIRAKLRLELGLSALPTVRGGWGKNIMALAAWDSDGIRTNISTANVQIINKENRRIYACSFFVDLFKYKKNLSREFLVCQLTQLYEVKINIFIKWKYNPIFKGPVFQIKTKLFSKTNEVNETKPLTPCLAKQRNEQMC